MSDPSPLPEAEAAVAAVSEPRPEASSEHWDGDLIRVDYRGRTCLFDGSTVKGLERPGLIYSALLKGRFYEHAFLDYIRSLDVAGVYVDVGACIGTHSLFFALMCPSTEVIAFEPRRHLFERVIRNIELNGVADKVTALQLGVSSTLETVTVRLDNSDATFECRPLDDLVSGRVDVIKIDVEGMEPRVIAGAAATLERWHPIVFAEAGQPHEYDALVAAMSAHGYAPTGRVFNATPTYEFVHRSRERRAVRVTSAARRLGGTIRRGLVCRRS